MAGLRVSVWRVSVMHGQRKSQQQHQDCVSIRVVESEHMFMKRLAPSMCSASPLLVMFTGEGILCMQVMQ
jgi:hypothetical protein